MGIEFKVGEEVLDVDTVVKMGARHPDFFYTTFFPKTARQKSPPFLLEMDRILDDASIRFAHFEAFRGSSKTTRLRMFTGRRIAYGLSKTILYIGASEDHAIRSIGWIKRQVAWNTAFSTAFGLRPGSKWDQVETEIKNEVTGDTTWIRGFGSSGSIRGVNFDDFRPDLIVLDDLLTDENVATLEQREKLIDLILGAIANSLAPVIDEPNAKMAMAQTPLHGEDASAMAKKDPQWTSLNFPCWTKETLDEPLEKQQSAWEERFPSEDLRKSKVGYIQRNKLSLWNREMECRLTSPEASVFKPLWLRTDPEFPPDTYRVLAIDPVPPPSDRELAKGLAGKDWEVIGVVGRKGPDYFVHEYVANRGHEPNWTRAKVFELATRWRVGRIIVEPVNYQRVLKFILEEEMKRQGIYYYIDTETLKQSNKFNRITNTVSGIASHGRLHFHPHQTELIRQFTEYPNVDHDDHIDMVSIALTYLINPHLENAETASNDNFGNHQAIIRRSP